MDEENQFWLCIWKCVTVTVCVLIVSVAGCQAQEDYRISQDVQHGADPLAAACAHQSSQSQSVCTPLAYKQR